MLHTCVRTFDVTGTIEKFLGTKQGLTGFQQMIANPDKWGKFRLEKFTSKWDGSSCVDNTLPKCWVSWCGWKKQGKLLTGFVIFTEDRTKSTHFTISNQDFTFCSKGLFVSRDLSSLIPITSKRVLLFNSIK